MIGNPSIFLKMSDIVPQIQPIWSRIYLFPRVAVGFSTGNDWKRCALSSGSDTPHPTPGREVPEPLAWEAIEQGFRTDMTSVSLRGGDWVYGSGGGDTGRKTTLETFQESCVIVVTVRNVLVQECYSLTTKFERILKCVFRKHEKIENRFKSSWDARRHPEPFWKNLIFCVFSRKH